MVEARLRRRGVPRASCWPTGGTSGAATAIYGDFAHQIRLNQNYSFQAHGLIRRDHAGGGLAQSRKGRAADVQILETRSHAAMGLFFREHVPQISMTPHLTQTRVRAVPAVGRHQTTHFWSTLRSLLAV